MSLFWNNFCAFIIQLEKITDNNIGATEHYQMKTHVNGVYKCFNING